MKRKRQTNFLLLNAFFLLLLLTQFVAIANPNNESKITRTTSKTFRVNPDVDVNLTNKYGKVVVNTWEKPSVKVEVNVTAYGKNDEVVQKLLKRVDFDFNHSSSYVDIQTVLDRKSGFLQDVWNRISDQAKVVLNKNRIQVDYDLYIPQMADISINNKFGDVFLGEMDTECKVKVAHGNLRAESLKKMSVLQVHFGKATIKSMEQGRLTVQAGQADVSYANMLEVSSHSSEIDIDVVKELQLDTRNDKLRIQEVDLLSGKSTFSKIHIEKFNKECNLTTNFGRLSIREVDTDFGQMRIEGKSTDITLLFQATAYFNWKLTSKEDKASLPLAAKIKSALSDDDKKLITQEGTMGKKKPAISYVSIVADGGDVNIRVL